jgi:serine/threonine protein kinase
MAELNLLKSLVDGRYEIRERKGQGSYAEIYTAADCLNNGELVIIKALNTSLQGTPESDLEHTLIRNFQNEAVALDTVRHPNIVRRLWGGTATDRKGKFFQYIVLEYMSGGDLLHKCRQEPLSFDDMLYYLKQVCEALAHAHKCDVIHRDIKPNNLLLSEDRKIVKIADFGVAKISHQDNEEITRVGTDVYAPPEHHPLFTSGELTTGELDLAPLTPSADIYSLAKTIYTLMSSRAPRQFKNRPITSLQPELQSEPWAGALLEVLRRATDSRVENRYSDALSFYKDLEAVKEANEEVTQVRATSVRRVNPVAPRAPITEKLPLKEPGEGRIVINFPQNQPQKERAKEEIKRVETVLDSKPQKQSYPSLETKAEDKPVKAERKDAEKKDAVKEKVHLKTGFWERADNYVFTNRKKILTIWAIVIFFILSLTILSSLDLLGARSVSAVVIRNVAVRSGPTTASDVLGYLRNGAKLEVLQHENNNWYQVKIIDPEDVKTANANKGWVYGDYIKRSSDSETDLKSKEKGGD